MGTGQRLEKPGCKNQLFNPQVLDVSRFCWVMLSMVDTFLLGLGLTSYSKTNGHLGGHPTSNPFMGTRLNQALVLNRGVSIRGLRL